MRTNERTGKTLGGYEVKVKSFTTPDTDYFVRFNRALTNAICTCPAQSHNRAYACKHMQKVVAEIIAGKTKPKKFYI